MMATNSSITISVLLDNEVTIAIQIVASSAGNVLKEISLPDAKEHGEAAIQLMEGCFYEYEITEGYTLFAPGVVFPFKMKKNGGHIKPNTYVGTLTLPVISVVENKQCGILQLEVRSAKVEYRTDYRLMLEEIAEKCVGLLMHHNTPVYQHLTIDFNEDEKTLYQRFAFIKGILDTEEFNDAIHKVLLSPVTSWVTDEVEKDTRAVRKMSSKLLRQIVTGTNRMALPEQHVLSNKLASVPQKLKVTRKKETTDTPENRFVKYALTHFLYYCSNFAEKLKAQSIHQREVSTLEEKITYWLSHGLFKEVTSLHTLPFKQPGFTTERRVPGNFQDLADV